MQRLVERWAGPLELLSHQLTRITRRIGKPPFSRNGGTILTYVGRIVRRIQSFLRCARRCSRPKQETAIRKVRSVASTDCTKHLLLARRGRPADRAGLPFTRHA
jgi:hypothetical protein